MCGRQPCTKTFSAYSSMVTFSKHPKHAGTENSTAWMADDCFSVLPHASTDCCMVEVWWILRGFSLVWTPKPPVWHGCSTDRSQQISQSKRSTAALINLYTSKLCWKWWRCDGFYVDLLFCWVHDLSFHMQAQNVAWWRCDGFYVDLLFCWVQDLSFHMQAHNVAWWRCDGFYVDLSFCWVQDLSFHMQAQNVAWWRCDGFYVDLLFCWVQDLSFHMQAQNVAWWRCDGFYVDLLFLLSTGTAQKTKNSTSWIFLGWLICALPTHRLRKQHFTDGRLVFAVLTHTGTESSTSRVAGWY